MVLFEGDSSYNSLYPEYYKRLEDFQACRTIDKGGHILSCPHCHTNVIYYNSCNQRGCPICHKKNQHEWRVKLKKKLLHAGHYHLVITIPEEYKDVWLLDQTGFINAFFYAVDKGFKKMQKELGVTLGIVTVFQSHGIGLSYKPHMHCIVSKHGLDSKNKCKSVGSMSYSIVGETVGSILKNRLISKAIPRHKDLFASMLKEENPRKCDVFPTIHKDSGDKIVNYLSKSTAGVVVDMDLLDYDEERNKVIVRDVHDGKERVTELDRDTFRERYLRHIPPKRVVTIRNYGLYSNKNKEKLNQLKRKLGEKIEEEKEEPQDICPECNHILPEKIIFKPHEDFPLLLKLYLHKYEDPPEYGARI